MVLIYFHFITNLNTGVKNLTESNVLFYLLRSSSEICLVFKYHYRTSTHSGVAKERNKGGLKPEDQQDIHVTG